MSTRIKMIEVLDLFELCNLLSALFLLLCSDCYVTPSWLFSTHKCGWEGVRVKHGQVQSEWKAVFKCPLCRSVVSPVNFMSSACGGLLAVSYICPTWTPANEFLPCQRLCVSHTPIFKGIRGAASTGGESSQRCSRP